MRQAAYVYYKISTLSLRLIILILIKRQISNKTTTLPDCNTGFIPDAVCRHNTLFVIKKETDRKDSNLIQAQVQVRF